MDRAPQRPWVLVFVFLFGLFAFLRIYQLTARPLHNDEGVNGFFTNNLIRSNEWKYDPNNYHGPTLFYFQLIPSWINGFLHHPGRFRFNDGSGLTVFSIRFTVACISLLALSGLLFCRGILGNAGTLAALFLAGTSCNFLYFARYYIHETYVVLFTFAVFLGCLFLRKTGRPLYFYLTVLSAALLFSTKETGVLHLFGLGVAYFTAGLASDLMNRLPFGLAARRIGKDIGEFFLRIKRHIPLGVLLAIIVWGFLFSSFFKNPAGLWDSFSAYLPWTKQGMESGHVKPWTYFISDILVAYELPLVVLSALGAVAAFLKNEKDGLFFTFWSVFTIAVYSIIPYKTPWCVINFIFPMALLSGYGVRALMEGLKTLGKPEPKKRASFLILIVASAVLLATLRSTWVVNYIEWDNEKHKQAYVHTSRDIFRLLRMIEDIGRTTGEGKNITINIVSTEYWPLPFYLKDYPSARFWGKVAGATPLDAPIILAFANQHTELKRQLRESYSIISFNLRPGAPIDMWINNQAGKDAQVPATIPDLLTSSKSIGLAPGLAHEIFMGATCTGTPVLVSRAGNGPRLYYDADSKKPLPPPFAVRWKGFIKIPADGICRFSLDSDDGSHMFLDGSLFIDNGGNHTLTRRSRSANLSAGFHQFEIQYHDAGGFAELEVFWKLPKKPEEKIPARLFFSLR